MMKLQCDVRAAEAATVFCCADEATLCDACDRRVHCANKLAGKHRRFSLLHGEPSTSPSAQKHPLCEMCQKRRGLLFCKEERKILCRQCDVPLHTATEMMRRHSRFLLTGVRLSSAPVDPPPAVSEKKGQEEENSSSLRNAGSCSGAGATTASASSISEYLTKTLPGWQVEDFLVDDADAVIAASSDASISIWTCVSAGRKGPARRAAERTFPATGSRGAAGAQRRRCYSRGAVGAADAADARCLERNQEAQSVTALF